MKTTTDMQLISVDRLIPYVNNARTHSPEQLVKLRSSLREFGFINPVIIDRNFNVIAGHGRIAVAKEEGIAEVPCVFADFLTEAQKKAYILADNRMALDAGWDEELLRIEIESLQGADFDVSLTGFCDDEIADLFAGDGEKNVKDDDFDLSAALEKAAFVERGDIWTVGRHRLMCGDATSAEDVAALMDGKKANLIVTDPSYDMRLVIESTKTNAGTRKLPMTDDVAQCFRAIIEDREAPEYERVVDGYAGFLFTDKNGYPEVAMHWEHRFNHMVKRYNDIYRVQIPNITPHVCRHTYCSNMAKSGMNPKTLQYLMGHSDIGVTLNTYTHLGLEDATDELRRMEELENARKELEKNKEEKPVSQKMFRAI